MMMIVMLFKSHQITIQENTLFILTHLCHGGTVSVPIFSNGDSLAQLEAELEHPTVTWTLPPSHTTPSPDYWIAYIHKSA